MNRHREHHLRTTMRGITLVELLTVMTIVAILGSLAVGAYGRYSLRASRTEGTSALLRIQVGEEKFYLNNNSYTTDFISAPSASPPGLGVLGAATTQNGRYTITLAAGTTGAIATSYLATATATGGQAQDDPNCLVLTIDDKGARTPADTTGCWK